MLTTHFWNPPALMELVEVVPGEINDPAVTERVIAALTSWGNKVPVLVRKDILGQSATGCSTPCCASACNLLNEGVADAETLDIVLKKSFGCARR